MSEVVDKEFTDVSEEKNSVDPEELNRLIGEINNLQNENQALKEIIIRMNAERYLKKEA